MAIYEEHEEQLNSYMQQIAFGKYLDDEILKLLSKRNRDLLKEVERAKSENDELRERVLIGERSAVEFNNACCGFGASGDEVETARSTLGDTQEQIPALQSIQTKTNKSKETV